MKKLILLLLLLASSVRAQLSPASSSTGSITTNAANCNTTNACVILHMATSNVGYSATVAGTWTGTLTVEQSGDNQGSWTSATTTTSNTLYTSALTPGITDVRVRGSAAMTGTAVVTITASGPAVLQQITQTGAGGVTPVLGVNVKLAPYNAVGDGKFFVDGVTNAGNNQLTSATATFAATDAVGHTVSCVNAPMSGAAAQALNAAVTSFVNSSTITYGGANAGVKTGMFCEITNNLDPPAILAAFNACKSTSNAVQSQTPFQAPGCNIYAPAGVYGVSNTLDNFVATGAEPCVGIIGDGIGKTIFLPTATFTNTNRTNGGWFIHDRCNQMYLADFTVEVAGNLVVPGFTNGAIEVGSTLGYLRNVAVYDQCNPGGQPIYGITADQGSNFILEHPIVVNNGNCTNQAGGLSLITVAAVDVFAPFLSNTIQNFKANGLVSGSNGSGSRIWGGLIDEGSITSIVNSVDLWIEGTSLTGGANCLSVDATSNIVLSGGYCGTFGAGTGGGVTVASGGKLAISNVSLRAINAGSYCYNSAAAGGILDFGDNRCTISGGATTYNAGSFVNTTSLTHTYPQPFLPALPASTTAQIIAAFTPSTAVSVVNFTVTASNTPTCATPPTFQITNGTQTITQTFASSAQISGPFNPAQTVTNNAFPAGTQITLSITNAAYTCATAPVNMNWSIEWQSTAPSL